jgi:hypothetical protein
LFRKFRIYSGKMHENIDRRRRSATVHFRKPWSETRELRPGTAFQRPLRQLGVVANHAKLPHTPCKAQLTATMHIASVGATGVVSKQSVSARLSKFTRSILQKVSAEVSSVLSVGRNGA